MTVWQGIDESEFAPVHRLKGSKWVRIIAHIRNNATGEVRQYQNEAILEDDADMIDPYIWEEGNFACDCNRESFFCQAASVDEPEEPKCSDDRFAVNLENPATGEIFYREF